MQATTLWVAQLVLRLELEPHTHATTGETTYSALGCIEPRVRTGYIEVRVLQGSGLVREGALKLGLLDLGALPFLD